MTKTNHRMRFELKTLVLFILEIRIICIRYNSEKRDIDDEQRWQQRQRQQRQQRRGYND